MHSCSHFFLFIPIKCTYVHLIGIKISHWALLFAPRLTGNVYAFFPHKARNSVNHSFLYVWPQLESIKQKQNYVDANRRKEHQNQQLFSLLHLKRKRFCMYIFSLLLEASETHSRMGRQCELNIHNILFYMSRCPHPIQFCNYHVICKRGCW